MTLLVAEMLWLKRLLEDLKVNHGAKMNYGVIVSQRSALPTILRSNGLAQ
jgi:hypothetical protein